MRLGHQQMRVLMNDNNEDQPTVIAAGASPHGRRIASAGTLPWVEKSPRADTGPSMKVKAAPPAAGVALEPLRPGLLPARLLDEGEIARGAMGAIHQVVDTAL